MTILILGLLLFLGIHLVPAVPALRARIAGTLGEKRYKGVFSLVSALGLALIVVGYARAPADPRLFAPFPLAVQLAPAAMLVSFVLFASANMRTHIRRLVRHPMLLGLGIWSLVHLLANGELRATVLFGAFLGFAAIDLASAAGRHAVKSFRPSAAQDAGAVFGGVGLALLVMAFHRPIFGAAAVPWGV
ncbi:MAG TPA: NnrU family protein [Noviherbaspirillum sp.]|jgi:uncharacterized membrane protein|uniref:NnrU family protein n=1 Tax=Noviherbaspirillum sp. TaxID=1926288 RepID=UPI002F92BFAE